MFTVVLATGLGAGVNTAFRASFWWLTAASAAGLLAAAWLAVAERRLRAA